METNGDEGTNLGQSRLDHTDFNVFIFAKVNVGFDVSYRLEETRPPSLKQRLALPTCPEEARSVSSGDKIEDRTKMAERLLPLRVRLCCDEISQSLDLVNTKPCEDRETMIKNAAYLSQIKLSVQKGSSCEVSCFS